MKKGDFIVIGGIFALAALLAIVFFIVKADGKTVIIKNNGETVSEYPIDEDKQIKLEHNTVNIENGTVYMYKSDCKNQICVKTGRISKRGECIVCLPNRVIIEIK